MYERTATCEVCGESFQVQPLGRTPRRCLSCLSPKQRAQKQRRASRSEPYARCAGTCGKPLSGLLAVDGLDAFCKACGPGPGVTRRSTCRSCGVDVWRRQRGGGHAPRRYALCDGCETTLKWCNTCEQAKPHDQFSTTGTKRLGLSSWCKACAAEVYHARDKLERIARKFGITPQRWRQLLEAQGGRCAVCRREPTDLPRGYLVVDHDHTCCRGDRSCGRCVRGLLCGPCNLALGQLHDDVDRLRAAITYLEKFGVG